MNIEKLYNKGISIESCDIVDPYTLLGSVYRLEGYKIYTLQSLLGGNDKIVRSVDIPDYAFDFIAEQGKCLGLANVINGHVDYIIFKQLHEKKFLTAGDRRGVPYGLGQFGKFKFGDWLVLVEGLKDRDILSTIYPNVLATQTAGMSSMMKEVLLTVTNRFILLYDNIEIDEAGKKAYYRDKKFLEEHNCQAVLGRHPSGYKDVGEIIDLRWKGDSFSSDYLVSFHRDQLYSIIGEY